MKEKIERFMRGRCGVDSLSRILLLLAVVFGVIGIITGQDIFILVCASAMVVSYFRILSRNHEGRFRENNLYLKYKNKINSFFMKQRCILKQRRYYHIYRCPSCKQKIRIPKGKGKIVITCPKCRAEFRKKS